MNKLTNEMKKITKQFIALEWAIIHMKETICGCEHFLTTEKSDYLRHCLMTGIVVSYARSFGENSNMSRIGPKFQKFEDTNLQEWHNDVLKKRNEIFVHWDVSAEKNILKQQDITEIGSVTLKPDGTVSSVFHRINEPEYITLGKKEHKDPFIQYIKKLAEFQKKRMEDSANKMLTHFFDINKYLPGTYQIGFDGEVSYQS